MFVVLLNMVVWSIVLIIAFALTCIAIGLIIGSIIRACIMKKRGKRTKKVGLWVGISMIAAPWVMILGIYLLSLVSDRYYNRWKSNCEDISKAVMAEDNASELYDLMADDVVSRNNISKEDLQDYLDKIDIKRVTGEDLEKFYRGANAGKYYHYRVYTSTENGRNQPCFQYRMYDINDEDGELYISGVDGDAKGTEYIGIYYISYKVGDEYIEFGEKPPSELHARYTSPEISDYGSFTSKKTFSYDRKYYIKVLDSDRKTKIVIFSQGNEVLTNFKPCDAGNFQGYCWASDSYDIWIQASDIGLVCYSLSGDEWVLNENAVKPDDIISKYE